MLTNFLQINQEKSQVARGGSFTAFIMFVIVGLILRYISSDMIIKGEESLKWPKTIGVVIESGLVKSQDDKGLEMYSPRVNVKYNVNGNEYQTSQIAISGSYSTSNSSSVRNIIAKYSKGKNVDVYYNDKDSAEAVLEPGVSTLAKILHYSSYVLFILALIMFGKFVVILGIVGVFIINFFTKKKPQNLNVDAIKSSDERGQAGQINFQEDGFSQ